MVNQIESAAIRKYLAEHPDAKPKEVVAALKKEKVKVTTTAVSSIKAYDKRTGRVAKVPVAEPAPVDNMLIALKSAKRFVSEVGGPATAKVILAAYLDLSSN